MVKIAFRRYIKDSLASRRGQVQSMMRDTDRTAMRVTPAALEILSLVSGRQLLPAQRRVLLETLVQHLDDDGPRPRNAGPLSQSDILGAVLGIAHFACHNQGGWLFVRIPEGHTKSPDVFGLPPAGKPWYLELKAVAPLSSEQKPGRPLNTCKLVQNQRREGTRQLNSRLPHTVPIGPTVIANGNRPPLVGIAKGGKSLSVVVLPDGALSGPNGDGHGQGYPCRHELQCVEDCLDGRHLDEPTSVVGLLWQESPQSPQDLSDAPATDPLRPVLLAVHAINSAVWANSTLVATGALLDLPRRLREARDVVDEPQSLEILNRVLVSARYVTPIPERQKSIDSFLTTVRDPKIKEQATSLLQAEGVHGMPEHRTIRPWRRRGEQEKGELLYGEVHYESSEYSAAGWSDPDSVRLAPTLDTLDATFGRNEGHRLLEQSLGALKGSILPDPFRGVPGPLWSSEQLGFRPITVRLEDAGSEFVVGYEWEGGCFDKDLLFTCLSGQARVEYQAAVFGSPRSRVDAFNRLRTWVLGNLDRIADCWEFEVKRLQEWVNEFPDFWLEFVPWPFLAGIPLRTRSTWASYDGRVVIRW